MHNQNIFGNPCCNHKSHAVAVYTPIRINTKSNQIKTNQIKSQTLFYFSYMMRAAEHNINLQVFTSDKKTLLYNNNSLLWSVSKSIALINR